MYEMRIGLTENIRMRGKTRYANSNSSTGRGKEREKREGEGEEGRAEGGPVALLHDADDPGLVTLHLLDVLAVGGRLGGVKDRGTIHFT